MKEMKLLYFKICYCRLRGMAQQLRAFAALPENLSSVPRTHVGQLTATPTPGNPKSQSRLLVSIGT